MLFWVFPLLFFLDGLVWGFSRDDTCVLWAAAQDNGQPQARMKRMGPIKRNCMWPGRVFWLPGLGRRAQTSTATNVRFTSMRRSSECDYGAIPICCVIGGHAAHPSHRQFALIFVFWARPSWSHPLFSPFFSFFIFCFSFTLFFTFSWKKIDRKSVV